MDFRDVPDGRRRKITGCILANGESYHIGEPAPFLSHPPIMVTAITGLGGYAGHLRICFDNGKQFHVANAIEVWEPEGDTDGTPSSEAE